MRMRFAVPLAAVFFAVGIVAATPAPPGARLTALLAKARAASGSPYLYHVVSHAQEMHNGHKFEVTTETEGPKFRAKSCSKSLCTGFYFDGQHSYQTNFNDTALPLTATVDGLQVTLRAIASYAFTDPDFRKNGGTLVEREPILHSGTRYRRVSVALPFGAPLDAVLDPATGLVLAAISGERKYAFEFADQRKVDGKIVLPYSVSLNGHSFAKYEDRSIVAAPLDTPAGLVPDLPAGDATVRMENREQGPQPVVPCTIGDQNASCMIDTGDSSMAISLELAEKLGLEPVAGTYNVHGVGAYITGVVRAPALHVGSAVYPPADYVVLHDVSQYGYDAILGADFFGHSRVTLDFGKREVRIAPSGTANGLPLRFEDAVPVISVGLGDIDVPLQIDTGDDGTVDLAYDYYERHLALFKPTGATAINGIGGDSEGVVGTIDGIKIAGFDVVHQHISATKNISFNGHVGSGLLDHFAVTLDYRSGFMELIPRAGDTSVQPTP